MRSQGFMKRGHKNEEKHFFICMILFVHISFLYIVLFSALFFSNPHCMFFSDENLNFFLQEQLAVKAILEMLLQRTL